MYQWTARFSDLHIDGLTIMLTGVSGGLAVAALPAAASPADFDHALQEYARRFGRSFAPGSVHLNLMTSRFHRLALRRDSLLFSDVSATIRIQVLDNPTREDLLQTGFITDDALAYLERAVAAGLPIVVAGEAGSAKTTLLRVLARRIPPHVPVLTVEETPELFLRFLETGGARHFHVVHDHVVQTGDDGVDLGYAELLRFALQESCQRMIIGEVAHGDAMNAFLTALSGHASGMTTIHASHLTSIIPRIVTLLQTISIPAATAYRLIEDNLAIVVHAQRQESADGIKRFVTGIGWVLANAGSADAPPTLVRIFERSPGGHSLSPISTATRGWTMLEEAEVRHLGRKQR